MLSHTLRNSVAAVAVAAGSLGGATAHAATVDTVLSLVIDISGSVDATEYNQQMDGYAAAFRNAAIQGGILDTGGGDLGRVAVNVIQFASSAVEAVTFQLLDSVATIDAFADTLDTLTRAGLVGSGTDIAEGIDLATSSINAWLTANTATRSVIDVSGDGQDSVDGSVTVARDAACGAGGIDNVNGIAIGGGVGLLDYFTDDVICGTDSFSIQADSFAEFSDAIRTKLNAEITGTPINPVPVPASLPLLVGGVAVMGYVASRRKTKAA